MRASFGSWAAAFAAVLVCSLASARGVSPYLPLNLSPHIERQIERVLILAGKPVMRRPIPAAVVLDALPRACELDRAACEQVRRYLSRYMDRSGVTSLDAELAWSTGDSQMVIPNRHGQRIDSTWRASASAYFQVNDYAIVNAGGVGHDDDVTATGSFLSVGFDFAQLDVGFRDHWLSPLADSSSLISTEAPTMPSITLSNYEPISPLGISYEVFFAEMSHQDGIAYLNSTTSGKPRLAGMQLGIEPVPGYALAVNRLSQYGGGARNRGAFSQFIDELFETGNNADTAGGETVGSNRVASLTSSLLFPGKVPFAVRIEYAGEDNAFEGPTRLGATNLSLGLDFPTLWNAYDATFEVSEWQNVWYIHHLYPKGLTNDDRVIGHWFGDNRRFGEAIGGRSMSLRGGWRLRSGDYLQVAYRDLSYDSDWVRFDQPRVSYRHLRTLGLSYSTSWHDRAVDAELLAGEDVFGESFVRLSASFDFAPMSGWRSGGVEPEASSEDITDVFVDIGVQRSRVREVMLDLGPNAITGPAEDYHVAVGARRAVSDRNDVGVRLELDHVGGHALISLRAVDYRFRFSRKFAVGAFFGAARYDAQLPAHGYYMGAGLQYLNVLPGWDLGVDYRYHEKLTRDKVLASDPPLTVQLPRRSFDINGVSLYLSRRW